MTNLNALSDKDKNNRKWPASIVTAITIPAHSRGWPEKTCTPAVSLKDHAVRSRRVSMQYPRILWPSVRLLAVNIGEFVQWWLDSPSCSRSMFYYLHEFPSRRWVSFDVICLLFPACAPFWYPGFYFSVFVFRLSLLSFLFGFCLLCSRFCDQIRKQTYYVFSFWGK